MNDPTLPPPDVHEETLLLPLYLSQRLPPAATQRIETHLGRCAQCRAELQEMNALRGLYRDSIESIPAPSPTLQARVMAGVRARQPPPRGTGGLETILRRLLRPHWAPALAASVLLVQTGVLTWMMQPAKPAAPIMTRSVAPAAVRLLVHFKAEARASDIQALVTSLQGRIVDGPTADGAYVLDLAPQLPPEIAQRLREIRSRQDVVESIDLAPP